MFEGSAHLPPGALIRLIQTNGGTFTIVVVGDTTALGHQLTAIHAMADGLG